MLREDMTDEIPSDVREHLQEVGLVCTQWAYVEWLLELTHWWLLDLLNASKEARLITSNLSIDRMASRVAGLSHLPISDVEDRARLAAVETRIKAVVDERNLAVHGIRSWHPECGVTGSVARGKYKTSRRTYRWCGCAVSMLK
jgi:hypothetical protein